MYEKEITELKKKIDKLRKEQGAFAELPLPEKISGILQQRLPGSSRNKETERIVGEIMDAITSSGWSLPAAVSIVTDAEMKAVSRISL